MIPENTQTIEDYIATITEDLTKFSVTKFDSEESKIVVVDFEFSGKRWVAIVSEEQGEITQTNIVGDKAIATLIAALTK